MASMILSRRSSSLAKAAEKLLFSGRAAAPVAHRSYNNSAAYSESDDDRSVGVTRSSDDAVASRRRGEDLPSFLSDAFDPFFGPRSLNHILRQVADPFVAATVPTLAPRRNCFVKEDNDALYLRVDMPGLGKEHVNVSVEKNTLVLKAEGEKEPDEEENSNRYNSRLELPAEMFKLDQIKAVMKNGQLKVIVPKVKEEERVNVIPVSVE